MLRAVPGHSLTRLSRHTSLGSSVARYASIHAFFSRQTSTLPLVTSTVPLAGRAHSWRASRSQLAIFSTHSAPHGSRRISDKSTSGPDASTNKTPDAPPPPDPPPTPPSNYPEFIRRMIVHAPHLHRPTRDELLSLTSGFWERFRIRFKWFTIRSFRKFNADDMSAFVTLLLFSQTVWILVGT
jgi:hypothetical protein